MKFSGFNLAGSLGGALAWVVVVSLVGCSFLQPSPPEGAGVDAAMAPPETDLIGTGTNLTIFKADTIHVGDRLTITYSGLPVPLPAHVEQVREDGQINPPLLKEPVLVAGKTVGELQDELHRLYVPGIYKAVTVTVTIPERYFWVGGEVKMPGQKPYLSQMTAVKAVQAAGDFTDFGDRKAVIVTRTDKTTVVVNVKKAIRDPKFDAPIYPGDQVHVRRRW